MESVDEGHPSALLTATTKILHFAVARIKTAAGLENMFTTSLSRALVLFANSLPDKMMLCACLGALYYETEHNNQVCSKSLSSVRHREIHSAIFKTLLDGMQVQPDYHGDVLQQKLCHELCSCRTLSATC